MKVESDRTFELPPVGKRKSGDDSGLDIAAAFGAALAHASAAAPAAAQRATAAPRDAGDAGTESLGDATVAAASSGPDEVPTGGDAAEAPLDGDGPSDAPATSVLNAPVTAPSNDSAPAAPPPSGITTLATTPPMPDTGTPTVTIVGAPEVMPPVSAAPGLDPNATAVVESAGLPPSPTLGNPADEAGPAGTAIGLPVGDAAPATASAPSSTVTAADNSAAPTVGTDVPPLDSGPSASEGAAAIEQASTPTPDSAPAVIPGTDLGSIRGTPRTETVSPATPSAPAPATPASQPSPGHQLVSVLAPLRLRHDGSAKLTLALRPEELGRVDVEVRFERGTMHLVLRAEQPATASLLRDTIEDLRGQLQDQGIATGDMSVGDQSHHREARRDQTPVVPSGSDDEQPMASIDPLATDADALVDVRM